MLAEIAKSGVKGKALNTPGKPKLSLGFLLPTCLKTTIISEARNAYFQKEPFIMFCHRQCFEMLLFGRVYQCKIYLCRWKVI